MNASILPPAKERDDTTLCRNLIFRGKGETGGGDLHAGSV